MIKPIIMSDREYARKLQLEIMDAFTNTLNVVNTRPRDATVDDLCHSITAIISGFGEFSVKLDQLTSLVKD